MKLIAFVVLLLRAVRSCAVWCYIYCHAATACLPPSLYCEKCRCDTYAKCRAESVLQGLDNLVRPTLKVDLYQLNATLASGPRLFLIWDVVKKASENCPQCSDLGSTIVIIK